MKLIDMNYVQWETTPREWRIDGTRFGPLNLLVGSNASGKSRTLNVINGLAKLLAGDSKVNMLSGSWSVTFENEGNHLVYSLQVSNSTVTKEEFNIDGTELLKRGAGGIGKIWAEKINDSIDFQVPEDQLAAVARLDSIQHPFFEPLNTWGKSLYHYQFGTPLGKHTLGIINPDTKAVVNARDPDQVIGIYRKGEKEFGEKFKESIKTDMAEIGYLIDDVGTAPPISIIVHGPQPIVVLYVRESGLGDVTDQGDMSQGMFRALSIIIQLNYSNLSGKPSCILIDDIGEGLDFERSCSLIKLLVGKAERSSVQLIMATNDRFVMNTVPLEAWTVLRRVGRKIRVYNHENSKKRFDEFKFTGMNNFDFFALNFLDESSNGK
jgi:energy-coupling factor transporter ATP-binding protein EcfA2